MPLRFNMLLAEAGISPRDVRLLRHQTVGPRRRTPYALWRDDPAGFERYQSAQSPLQRTKFSIPYWASFVVPADKFPIFVGLYEVGAPATAPADWIDPLTATPVGTMGQPLPDLYPCQRSAMLSEYIGRVKIDWGKGMLAWVQHADGPNGDKPIIELTQKFREPEFPGYTRFISNLAGLPNIPPSWSNALAIARGVYLLTCPQTREQYVGAAHGIDGFWGRWQDYVNTGHGGNVGLKSRDPTDYQVSILEVAGSAASEADILIVEKLWKDKLQSREMGLNKN